MRTLWRLLFIALAVSFLSAAVFHVSAAIDATVEPRMTRSWHVGFAVVDVAFTIGMLLRPRGFLLALAVLVVQQLYSHGSWGLQAWREGWVDWRSLVTVISLPLMLLAVWMDPTRRRPAA